MFMKWLSFKSAKGSRVLSASHRVRLKRSCRMVFVALLLHFKSKLHIPICHVFASIFQIFCCVFSWAKSVINYQQESNNVTSSIIFEGSSSRVRNFLARVKLVSPVAKSNQSKPCQLLQGQYTKLTRLSANEHAHASSWINSLYIYI